MRQPSQAQRERLRTRGAERREATPLPAELSWDPTADLDATLDPAPRRGETALPARASEPDFSTSRWTRIFFRNLLMVALVGGIPTVAGLGIGVSAWVSKSAVPVRQAAAEARGAQDAYFETLEHSQEVVQALGAHGAPTAPIETVYFTFLDSPEADKPENADALLDVLDTEAGQVRARRGADQDTVSPLLVPAHAARAEVSEAVAAWDASTKHYGASLAVAMGLAPAPEGDFLLYASANEELAQRER